MLAFIKGRSFKNYSIPVHNNYKFCSSPDWIETENLGFVSKLMKKKIQNRDFKIKFNLDNNLNILFDINKYQLKNNNTTDTMLKDILNEYYLLKYNINISSELNNINMNCDIYLILETRSDISDYLNNYMLINTQIVPSEFVIWYKQFIKELDLLKIIDFQEYKELIKNKLTEIYKVTSTTHKLSKNFIVDIDNNIVAIKSLLEYEQLAIEYYKTIYKKILQKRAQSRINFLQKIFNNNIWFVKYALVIRFLEKNETNKLIIMYGAWIFSPLIYLYK